MTEVKLLKSLGGHEIGDKINVTPASAKFLVNSDLAEAVEVAKKSAPKNSPKPAAKADSNGVGGDSPASDSLTAG